MILRLLALLVLAAGVPEAGLAAQGDAFRDGDPARAPVVTAAPAENVTLDGVLDEAAWAGVEPATGFRQFQPDEGAAATYPTEVRVLYGPGALFIGAEMTDDEPSAIRRILTRRDQIGEADRLNIAIDSYLDRQSAYVFAISAAGVQYDALLTGDDEDDSWDAVWDAEVRITDRGWTAEIRIPYSQLRFNEAPEQTWGVQFQRTIPRLGERDLWAPFTRQQANAGVVQYFGRLEGIRGISPRNVLQILPYSVARARQFEAETAPGTSDYGFTPDAGVDLKLGLASNVILDATLNPDFGQVESDPAELNLGTFETFFPERRPFFLEGTQIFDYGIGGGRDGSLLYTRRIGGDARVIGATKLTGRLSSGLSFGGLAAVTGDDFSPGRLFAAARLKQEFGGVSYLGAGLTAYESGADVDGARALAGGADWDVRLGGGRFQVEGSLTGAYRRVPGEDDALGYAFHLGADQVRGDFTGGFGLRVFSDEFEINNLGRFRQNDLVSFNGGGRYLLNGGDPFGPFRRANLGGFSSAQWSYTDWLFRGGSVFFFSRGELRGFQSVELSGRVSGIGGFDVRETRGLGPVVNGTDYRISTEFGTDERQRLRFEADLGVGTESTGGFEFDLGLEAEWNASDRVQLEASVELGRGDGFRAWAANESLYFDGAVLGIATATGAPDELDGSRFDLGLDPTEAGALIAGLAPYDPAVPGAFYAPVFGRRDTRQAEVELRANVIFQPSLSLQVFSQLFGARGRYRDFSLVAGPDDLRPFADYPKRRDFSFQSLLLNAVLRWEYRPGSTFFVVLSQSRLEGADEELLLDGRLVPDSPFDMGTLGQLGDTFSVFPESVFLVKFSYLIMR